MRLADDLRCEPRVADDRRETGVVEPIHIAGADVEAKEVIGESAELDAVPIVARPLKLRAHEGAMGEVPGAEAREIIEE